MRFLGWREKTWLQRALLVLTIVALALLASHPELRLFVPLVDLLGIDLLFLLMASQIVDTVRPALAVTHRLVLGPIMRRTYAVFIFFLGIAGPYIYGLMRDQGTSLGAENGVA